MNGQNAPRIIQEKIRATFDKPPGGAILRELARGRNEVAIILDDISRLTRVAELMAASVPDKSIQIYLCHLRS